MKSVCGLTIGILVINLVISIVSTADDTTIAAMESNGIVPDVIDVAPKEILQITYPSGVKVELGNELTPTQVKDKPDVTWSSADDGSLYTLLMTDPDAPSRENPTVGEVRHWLVVNIPGNKVSEGKTVFGYRGSGPPKDTGLHRYIFLVFKQNASISIDKSVASNSREGRIKTKTRDIIAEHQLGTAIAGNFYQAQYDDYVPILQQQTV